jgi:rRNA-processing protein FCF1
MPTVLIFPDTNTFVHYRPIREVDWLKLVNAEAVEIIVAQVVLRELNRIKDSSKIQKKLRERADLALRTLKPLRREPTIRPGVSVRFQEHDPVVDFASFKLSTGIEDDWLVASVLERKQELPDGSVILVTADQPLQVKADYHHLAQLELPERYRLPRTVDEDQRRIRELELELQTLKCAHPDLKLTFGYGTNFVRMRMNKHLPQSEDEIAAQIVDLRVKRPKIAKPNPYSDASPNLYLIRSEFVAPDVDRYNTRLEVFYQNYSEYLRKLDRYRDVQSRTIELEVYLLNSGSSPADDIDIYLHLPDGLEVFGDLDETGAAPEVPIPPAGPMSALAESLSNLAVPSLSSVLLGRNLDLIHRDLTPPNVSAPTIRRTNSFEIRFHVQTLKHKLQIALDPLFVVFDSWDTAKSFTIDYTLYAGNVPDAITDQLHVVVEL